MGISDTYVGKRINTNEHKKAKNLVVYLDRSIKIPKGTKANSIWKKILYTYVTGNWRSWTNTVGNIVILKQLLYASLVPVDTQIFEVNVCINNWYSFFISCPIGKAPLMLVIRSKAKEIENIDIKIDKVLSVFLFNKINTTTNITAHRVNIDNSLVALLSSRIAPPVLIKGIKVEVIIRRMSLRCSFFSPWKEYDPMCIRLKFQTHRIKTKDWNIICI
jgi:hypothetical protein